MNAFDSMFDMDGDGSLDIAERAHEMCSRRNMGSMRCGDREGCRIH
jgi:hypothetical protein